LQPYWKPDLKNPEAKGSIIGFNDVHTRAHIYRAIIEGINYSLYEGLERIQRVTKTKIDKIYVSGGGSSSDSICQITADMFGLSVVRGETYESSGLGAAITGYVSLGIYSSYEEAIQEMVRETDFFEPDMKTHEKYDKIYHLVYKKIYQRLKKLYKIMDQL
jgi:sugar (pentulose or hexulose) kinase